MPHIHCWWINHLTMELDTADQVMSMKLLWTGLVTTKRAIELPRSLQVFFIWSWFECTWVVCINEFHSDTSGHVYIVHKGRPSSFLSFPTVLPSARFIAFSVLSAFWYLVLCLPTCMHSCTLCLAYFAQHDALQLHVLSFRWQGFLLHCRSTTLHCIQILLLYTFICGWVSRPILYLIYCE